ncbi:MAG: fused MFS/spermidine synthase [Myxococcales bacterium]|nr:fused MFS/spermidine synthase [Myxococcales bacterium]
MRSATAGISICFIEAVSKHPLRTNPKLSIRSEAPVHGWLIFAAATLCSASLLFVAQPMVGKLILPHLGGGPAVWTSCMLFFQTVLLAGYLCAHLVSLINKPVIQLGLYILLLGAAALTLPIGLPETLPDAVDSPAIRTIQFAAMGIGLPFFVLSMASPLLQFWFARSRLPGSGNPYGIYIASNIGSLLALVGYPVVIEPLWPMSSQTIGWTWMGLVFAILALTCGVLALRYPATVMPTNGETPTVVEEPTLSNRWVQRFSWLVFSFVPSTLMLGTTHHLTSNIAPVPMFWTVPLAIYLLTFIVAFSAVSRVVSLFSAMLVAPLSAIVGWLIWSETPSPMGWISAAHLVLLWSGCMACHGRLWARRPKADRLTEFYLFLSIGGALGGVFNTVVAPQIFVNLTEYTIAIALCCFFGGLRLGALRLPKKSPNQTNRRLVQSRRIQYLAGLVLFVLAPIAAGVDQLLMPLLPSVHHADDRTLLYAERTFFGIYKVQQKKSGSGHWHELWHGRTLHGMQYDQPPWSLAPTTYYFRSGPAGDIFSEMLSRPQFQHAALVGLGAGTVATYAAENTHFTFFELDPAVVRIAQDPKLFTYITDSRGKVDVVTGDARITMQNVPDAQFDLIMLDAFGSDAIPVHLITREAIELYLRKLKPHGLIAFHTTNWYLDLEPVLAAVSYQLGLVSLARRDFGELTSEDLRLAKYKSGWAILTRTPEDFGALAGNALWTPLISRERFRPWTDDYSDLLEVFRW